MRQNLRKMKKNKLKRINRGRTFVKEVEREKTEDGENIRRTRG